ncbi:transcription initiation factor TFIID subunit 12 isoform X2 [Ricinus communis]|uniref:transcription initiation factor TFIID subunit 12 isoform X2 n=1 Tax=Ricinus communis TaxID=3988 RepID=UPI00201A9E17|nr:transcription initiation factor TFIID subunit 12 isoform X2 [Ricinus communis]
MDNQAPSPSTTTTSLPSQPSPQPQPQPQQPLQQPPSPALQSPAPPQQQQPQLLQQQQQPTPASQPQSASAVPASPSQKPNPNPKPSASTTTTTTTPLITQPQSQPHTTSTTTATNTRPPQLHRPWPNPHPHFSHFSSIPSSSSSPSVSPPIPATLQPRGGVGGVTIGVPAPSPGPPFTSTLGQQFTANSQVRPGMGMMGSMNTSSSQIRANHQQRPALQSPVLRPSNNHSSTTHNFQGQGYIRPSLVGSGSPAPNTSQNLQSPNQPWLSSGSQGKPPLPSPSYRPQINSPSSLQQRSHIPQQHQSLPTNSQQQHMSPSQPHQSLTSHPPSEHLGQQFPPTRGPRSITQQLALQSLPNQKPSSLAVVHPSPVANTVSNTVQPGTLNRTAIPESDESGNRILSKRNIHELVTQIDPSEKLDPEVEDILADIADEFVESITTFGCSLAKHRKSDTLEAKDILLHLERNWNMTLPGFSGDEIKTYRKPLTSDIHKERLAVIKKSILASDMASAKSSVGQAAGNAKSNLTRTPANAMISPNLKI